MKRLLLITTLLCGLLTAGAQTDKSQRSKTKPQSHANATSAKPTTPKKQSQPTNHHPTTHSKPDQPTGATQSQPSGSYGGHDYVDLGLSSGTLWATCNVGALKPHEYGIFFSWGETEPKNNYDWSTYKYCKGDSDRMTKYCEFKNYGTVDKMTELELEDDAASMIWGEGWHMPSMEQLDELVMECTWTWSTQNDRKGYIVKSKKNDNSLFLPAAGSRGFGPVNGGYGEYWSLSLSRSNSNYAYCVSFRHDKVSVDTRGRYNGLSVRPVRVSSSEIGAPQ